jgi:hypothetical protein
MRDEAYELVYGIPDWFSWYLLLTSWIGQGLGYIIYPTGLISFSV